MSDDCKKDLGEHWCSRFKDVKPTDEPWKYYAPDYEELERRCIAQQQKMYSELAKGTYYYGLDPVDLDATSEYHAPPPIYDCAGCNKQVKGNEALIITYPNQDDAVVEEDNFCPSCSKALLTDISYRKKYPK